MAKQEFEFYQDVKVTVWQRQHFTIEAETAEEARELAKQYADKDISCCDEVEADEIEWLYDTEEQITPEENNGCATIEVYEPEGKYKGKLIADNAVSKELSGKGEERKIIGYQVLDVNDDIPDGLFSFQVFRTEQDAKDFINECGLTRCTIHEIYEGDIEEPSFLGRKQRTFGKNEYVMVYNDSEGYFLAVIEAEQETEYEEDEVDVVPIKNGFADCDNRRLVPARDIYQYAEGKNCPRCGCSLCIEHHDEIDYPYFCPSCDENFYGIEVQ